MIPPTYLPGASLARTHFPVGASALTMSSTKLFGRLRTVGYLAFFWILVGTSSLTTVRPQPNDQIAGTSISAGLSDENSELVVENHHLATPAIQLQNRHEHFSGNHEKLHPLLTSVYPNGSQPLQLRRLLTISSTDLSPAGETCPEFLSAQQDFASVLLKSTAPSTCGGRCWDPHPGPFRFWYGQQNGCWVQVWRSWQEGCQHYQWYNSCNGYWDLHPNGAPKVNWTCCVH